MSTSDRSGIIAKMQAHPDNRHGDIYRWLKKNRRAVKDGFKSTGAGWDSVVAALSEAGVTGRDGTPANRKSVRRVWARVCADLDAAAAARKSKRATAPHAFRAPPPSRQRQNWQPPIADASRSTPPSGHLRGAATLAPGSNGTTMPTAQTAVPTSPSKVDLSPHAEAELEKLARLFAKTDRKRFGNL